MFLPSPPALPEYDPMPDEFSGRVVFSKFVVVMDIHCNIDVYFLVFEQMRFVKVYDYYQLVIFLV